MMQQNSRRIVRAPLIIATALLALAACRNGPAPSSPQVDIRGTNPSGSTSTQTQSQSQPQPGAASAVIVQNDGYQSVIAQDGDTVASLAQRAGLSASELGAYNGLQPTQQLRAGDELIVPPGAATTPQATAQQPASQQITTSSLETTPLDGSDAAPLDEGVGDVADGTLQDGTLQQGIPVEDPDLQVADATSAQAGNQPAWSPDIAAAAIDRSVGVNDDGSLGAPPSSTEPVPPEPTGRRTLESPDLSQYQTEASSPDAAPAPETRPNDISEDVTAALTPSQATTQRPVKLLKPVQGPIAVGFQQGSGPAKNDGVDFAAPAGARVLAADDGEVALVSQSLGGLGTIVLLRHANELLTVYGRIDGVTVAKGDIVRRGQQIGVVSDAAAPAEPRMHFEVRRGATVLDPTLFL
ncbi:MAG: peptidoglycan DD-metalloendopeptidase family protein [Pseudomonadota bacterium]